MVSTTEIKKAKIQFNTAKYCPVFFEKGVLDINPSFIFF